MNSIKKIIRSFKIYKYLYKIYEYMYITKRKHVMKNYDKELFYLNIGAGKFCRKNWRIIEYTDQNMPSYKYDLSLIDFNLNLFTNPEFPIKDNSVDLIYSSHTFEHLNDKNVEHILKESFRILKNGGGLE